MLTTSVRVVNKLCTFSAFLSKGISARCSGPLFNNCAHSPGECTVIVSVIAMTIAYKCALNKIKVITYYCRSLTHESSVAMGHLYYPSINKDDKSASFRA